MSWSRLAVVTFLMLLGPSACGLHPLHGKRNGKVDDSLAAVRIMPIPDRQGQQLRNALVERFSPRGEAAKPEYTLNILLSSSMSGTGIRKDATASLGEKQMWVSYTLVDSNGRTIAGNAYETVLVNYLGPRYASVAVERDAEERAINQLADSIAEQVAVYLRNPSTREQVQKPVFQQ